MPGRGHALTIDSGWREVADVALAFVRRHGAGRVAAAQARPARAGTGVERPPPPR
jgi:hypothetical protein